MMDLKEKEKEKKDKTLKLIRCSEPFFIVSLVLCLEVSIKCDEQKSRPNSKFTVMMKLLRGVAAGSVHQYRCERELLR